MIISLNKNVLPGVNHFQFRLRKLHILFNVWVFYGIIVLVHANGTHNKATTYSSSSQVWHTYLAIDSYVNSILSTP